MVSPANKFKLQFFNNFVEMKRQITPLKKVDRKFNKIKKRIAKKYIDRAITKLQRYRKKEEKYEVVRQSKKLIEEMTKGK